MAPTPAKKGPLCSIEALIRRIPEAEAAALRAMLDDRNTWVNGQDIVRELQKQLGFRTTNQTLNRHRRGECGCESR